MKLTNLIDILASNTIIEKLIINERDIFNKELVVKIDVLDFYDSHFYKIYKNYKVLNITCTRKERVSVEILYEIRKV